MILLGDEGSPLILGHPRWHPDMESERNWGSWHKASASSGVPQLFLLCKLWVRTGKEWRPIWSKSSMFLKQFMCLRNKSLCMSQITDAGHFYHKATFWTGSWVFRIVAGSTLREGVKLIEREERAKIFYPDPLFSVVPRKPWKATLRVQTVPNSALSLSLGRPEVSLQDSTCFQCCFQWATQKGKQSRKK